MKNVMILILKYDIIFDPHILTINDLSSIRGKQPIFANAYELGLHV